MCSLRCCYCRGRVWPRKIGVRMEGFISARCPARGVPHLDRTHIAVTEVNQNGGQRNRESLFPFQPHRYFPQARTPSFADQPGKADSARRVCVGQVEGFSKCVMSSVKSPLLCFLSATPSPVTQAQDTEAGGEIGGRVKRERMSSFSS